MHLSPPVDRCTGNTHRCITIFIVRSCCFYVQRLAKSECERTILHFPSASLWTQTCFSNFSTVFSSTALKAMAPAVILPLLAYVCVRACVSSCTHTQLMKCKCLAAVVTVVRLSRCLQSKAPQSSLI